MTTFRYNITSGLAGCYMPDGYYGPVEGHTRKYLADLIRDHIEYAGFPKSTFKQAKIVQLWKIIKHFGSSSVHFTIKHKGYEVVFHGLTEDEYKAMVKSEEWCC